MAFPASLHTAKVSSGSETLGNTAGTTHSALHDGLEADVAGLTTAVGVTGSADTTSITYKQSGIPAGDKAASLTGTETLTNKTISGSSNTLTNISAASLASQAWTSYTPTWISNGTAPSLGNGTITGKYAKIGRTVAGNIQLLFGSTTSKGTGVWFFSFPVAPATTASSMNMSIGGAYWVDATNGNEFSGFTRQISSGAAAPYADKIAVYYISNTTSSQTPGLGASFMSWSTGSVLTINFTYEAAS